MVAKATGGTEITHTVVIVLKAAEALKNHNLSLTKKGLKPLHIHLGTTD